jgi:hypothetical protein
MEQIISILDVLELESVPSPQRNRLLRLCTVRDLTHNKFTDSLIGGIVAPLSNGPVYFDCYPNFSIYTFDENIENILKLQIRTTGFDMCPTRNKHICPSKGML